jgi:hypothetical protein
MERFMKKKITAPSIPETDEERQARNIPLF